MLNAWLANEETTGALFEISGGWAAQTRWQRAGGHGFPVNRQLTPEDVASKWKIISNFGKLLGGSYSYRHLGPSSKAVLIVSISDDNRTTNPLSTQEAIAQVLWPFLPPRGIHPFDLMIISCFLHPFVAFSMPCLISRSLKISKTSPRPTVMSLMTRQIRILHSYARRKETFPNPRITPTRNVMLYCTTSPLEQRSKSYIGHSRIMKILLHCPLSESSLNS